MQDAGDEHGEAGEQEGLEGRRAAGGCVRGAGRASPSERAAVQLQVPVPPCTSHRPAS